MSHTEILFFGTGEIPRRNLNRVLDNFFEGEEFSEDDTLVGIFFADEDWSATTDAAFDYVLESDNFDDEPVVMVPKKGVADQKLVDDLADEGAAVERYDDIYDGVLTRAEFTHAICLFDEEDEDLAEDVMRLVEDGRKVYDAVGGMLEFDIAVEDPEDVEDSPESVDSPDSADTPEDEDGDMHPKVRVALDQLTEAFSEDPDVDASELASKVGRSPMLKVMDYIGVEVYKGMHTKTMVDEALDWIDARYEDMADADDTAESDSVDSPESVDSPVSEDSPEEDEVVAEVEAATVEEERRKQDRREAKDRPVQDPSATPATAHVNFGDIVALLGLFSDGEGGVDVDAAVEAAAAFGLTFDDVR